MKRAAVAAILFLALMVPHAAAHNLTGSEHYVLGLVNGARSTRGIRGLTHSHSMMDCARRHAARMASEGRIWHSRCGYAENVGMGRTLASISRALWRSDGHRANLVCSCTRTGVGVIRRDGIWYVVQQFR